MATLANDNPLAPLRAVVSPAALLTDGPSLALFSHDVLSQGAEPLAVFRPANVEELAAGIGAATRAGIAIVPRGGGMSYTGGYLYSGGPHILIDTGALTQIVEVNEADLTALVEVGCTWDALNAALSAKGLRALAWGTLSGIRATIGGGDEPERHLLGRARRDGGRWRDQFRCGDGRWARGLDRLGFLPPLWP